MRSSTMNHNMNKQLSRKASALNSNHDEVEHSVVEVGDDLNVLEEFVAVDVSSKMATLN